MTKIKPIKVKIAIKSNVCLKTNIIIETYNELVNPKYKDRLTIKEYWNLLRHDPFLIKTLEKLKKQSPEDFSHWTIKELELKEGKYYIEDNDKETIITYDSIDWIEV